jgi:hypothetical protein
MVARPWPGDTAHLHPVRAGLAERAVHDYAAKAGLGMCSIPWPRGQVLFVADPEATEQSLEQVVSVAYCSALP